MSYLYSGSPLSSVQQAVFFLLNNDATLRNQVNAVYDYVPSNFPYPYVQLGTFYSQPSLTFTNYGEDVIATIYVYCRNQELAGGPQGSLQTEQIMNTINRILAAKIFPIGDEWANMGCWFDSSNVMVEKDGITWNGILKYRIAAINRYSIFGVSRF